MKKNENEKNENSKNAKGLYTHSRCENEEGLQYSINSQMRKLEEYCKKNNIDNVVKYTDIGSGENLDDRPMLRKMIEDIKKGKIDEIITTSLKISDFVDECFPKDIKVISLDTENTTNRSSIPKEIENEIKKEVENMETDIEY